MFEYAEPEPVVGALIKGQSRVRTETGVKVKHEEYFQLEDELVQPFLSLRLSIMMRLIR